MKANKKENIKIGFGLELQPTEKTFINSKIVYSDYVIINKNVVTKLNKVIAYEMTEQDENKF